MTTAAVVVAILAVREMTRWWDEHRARVVLVTLCKGPMTECRVRTETGYRSIDTELRALQYAGMAEQHGTWWQATHGGVAVARAKGWVS